MAGVSGSSSFSEYEERYLLAEILKVSTVPPGALLNFLRDAGIEPTWNDIALPTGRSITACRYAFEALATRTPADLPPRPKKRLFSFGDPAPALIRDIQPRPPLLPAGHAASAIAPGPSSPPTVEEPVKRKRGRPTKAEHERRVAEAALRGEPYPKARKPKTTRYSEAATEDAETSSEGLGMAVGLAARTGPLAGIAGTTSGPQQPSLPILFTPNTTGPPSTSGSGPTPSKKKKRGHPSDSPSSQSAAAAPYAQMTMG